MIEFKRGDIINESAEALVNSVNCVGVMGKGVALQFKLAFPANFKEYAAACRSGQVEPGRVLVHETAHLTNPRYIINFPTKRHWRGKSRIEDIESGLRSLKQEIASRGIRSVALPPLGSGLGGLNWAEVKQRIVQELRSLGSVRVIVFEPAAGIRHRPEPAGRAVAHMTPGRAALLTLMRRYLAGLLDPFVTRLEVHKLMYFMQEAGEPLDLRFKSAKYGPYAENLKFVLREIEGCYITSTDNGSEAPSGVLQLVPGALRDADVQLRDQPDTRARLERVADLVEGFESPFGLELLSTVHWVAAKGGATTPDDIVAKTYAWGPRKKRFSPEQIRLALSVLKQKHWLPAC
jgi:O-acetyl-ADP-ribose deacetylase (regulator of RNase III)